MLRGNYDQPRPSCQMGTKNTNPGTANVVAGIAAAARLAAVAANAAHFAHAPSHGKALIVELQNHLTLPLRVKTMVHLHLCPFSWALVPKKNCCCCYCCCPKTCSYSTSLTSSLWVLCVGLQTDLPVPLLPLLNRCRRCQASVVRVLLLPQLPTLSLVRHRLLLRKFKASVRGRVP